MQADKQRMPLPGDMPDWAALIGTNPDLWRNARALAAKGKRVLIATNVGGHGPVGVMESMLAVALSLRGADVTTLLCDQALPACLKAEHADIPDASVLVDRQLAQKICAGCVWRGKAVTERIGTRVEWISQHVTEAERAQARDIAESIKAVDIVSYHHEGLSVGEHARAGALRYFARGDLSAEPLGEAVLRRYLEAALLSVFATRSVIRQFGIEVAVFHHGLYVPQGLVGEVCRQMGVRVVNWFVSYRKNTFIFSHDDTYHHTLMTEPVDGWAGMRWDDSHREAITGYLKSRWYGSRDWIAFHEKPKDLDEDFKAFAAESKLDLSRPIIGLLTNVVWDAQLHYPANAFPNMIEWVLHSIRVMASRPELQLLIRVHPAEIRGTSRSRQPIMDEIRAAFPVLPGNVHIIPPESGVSTYRAMEQCDSVIIYGTKTGVELTSMGIPTIVAGEAWIRGKGVTTDASSVADYDNIMGRLPLGRRLEADVVDRARRYAYHFFFRRMMPFPFMQANGKGTLFSVAIENLRELAPGVHKGLDIACDGILDGTEFVYPAEQLGVHDA